MLSLAVTLVGLVLVSACTTTSWGEPRPTTVVATTTGGDLPFAGAPRVDDPLDTSRFEADPGQALSADQTQPLNLPGTGQPMEHVALGTGCEWKNTESRGYAQIVFAEGDEYGLSAEYQANEDGDWEYFEELPAIAGYPAITRAGNDSRHVGHCIVVAGVADDMVFEAIAQLSERDVGQKDPCAMAAQAAGLALQTMTGAT